MAGYRRAGEQFVNATTKNDQMDRQRVALEESNQQFLRSSDLGVGSDTSAIFPGFDADEILASSVDEFSRLDIISNFPNGNPDFEGVVSMTSEGTTSIYDEIDNVNDKPNKKGPNLIIPDLDQLIQGSVTEASETVGTRFENKGFGWRDDRNEPGTSTTLISQYFSKHYNSTGESSDKPTLGESKDLGNDVIDYKQT